MFTEIESATRLSGIILGQTPRFTRSEPKEFGLPRLAERGRRTEGDYEVGKRLFACVMEADFVDGWNVVLLQREIDFRRVV